MTTPLCKYCFLYRYIYTIKSLNQRIETPNGAFQITQLTSIKIQHQVLKPEPHPYSAAAVHNAPIGLMLR